MAKEKFERTKPHCNVGTIGHIDHGKTTLTAAITKVLQKHNPKIVFRSFDSIDNAPEEKARGIHDCHGAPSSTRHRTGTTRNVELPGPRGLHQEHDCTLRRRNDGMGAILVVAATDGPMPQTRESRACCAPRWAFPTLLWRLNKVRCGGRSGVRLDLVELEVRELLKSYQFPGEDDL